MGRRPLKPFHDLDATIYVIRPVGLVQTPRADNDPRGFRDGTGVSGLSHRHSILDVLGLRARPNSRVRLTPTEIASLLAAPWDYPLAHASRTPQVLAKSPRAAHGASYPRAGTARPELGSAPALYALRPTQGASVQRPQSEAERRGLGNRALSQTHNTQHKKSPREHPRLQRSNPRFLPTPQLEGPWVPFDPRPVKG